MQQQFVLNHEVKIERLKCETMAREEFLNAQKRNEDLRTLAISTAWMDPVDAAIIEELKIEIRAKYYRRS